MTETEPLPTAPTPPTASDAPRAEVHLRLADLPKEHLAGDGNWLYKVPFGDGFGVLKIYTGNRNPLLHVKKTFGNWAFTGRTSHMPRARCAYEIACVELWAKHGFQVFGMHPEAIFDDVEPGTYMLYDFTVGLQFRDYFRDDSVPLEERLSTWRRFLPEWHRRHRLAIELGEPRLIHENGDCKHVLLMDDDSFTSFDFEIGFRSSNIRDLVGREMLAYLRSFGRAMYKCLLDETVAHYPDPSLLMAAWEHAFHNANPFSRMARALDYRFKRKDGGDTGRVSKYRAALDLKQRLDAASLTERKPKA